MNRMMKERRMTVQSAQAGTEVRAGTFSRGVLETRLIALVASLSLIAGLVAASAAHADVHPVDDAKAAGHEVGEKSAEAGHAIKENSKEAGHAIKRDSKAAGHGIKNGAKSAGHAIGNGAKSAGHAIGEGARATGHAVASGVKTVGHSVHNALHSD
jgi:hypothetical protein